MKLVKILVYFSLFSGSLLASTPAHKPRNFKKVSTNRPAQKESLFNSFSLLPYGGLCSFFIPSCGISVRSSTMPVKLELDVCYCLIGFNMYTTSLYYSMPTKSEWKPYISYGSSKNTASTKNSSAGGGCYYFGFGGGVTHASPGLFLNDWDGELSPVFSSTIGYESRNTFVDISIKIQQVEGEISEPLPFVRYGWKL